MRLAGAGLLELHAAPEFARAQPQERDAVAMVRVHVGLDLEDEAGDFGVGGMHGARPCGLLRRGGGALRASASSSSRTPKFFSAEPK